MDKREIRRLVAARKRAMDEQAREYEAQAVVERLETIDEFGRAGRILVYNSLPDELSTLHLLGKYNKDKQLFLPRVNGDDLEILPYDSAGISVGAFGIGEPVGDELVDPSSIDLVIVPAMAYDRHCNRVGRGKGFYDRLLSRMQAVTIGICYDCQLVDSIEPEQHDRPVDIVVTPSGIYRHHS